MIFRVQCCPHMEDIYCPVYKNKELLLTPRIGENDIIDISQDSVEDEKVYVTNGSLIGQEGQIKKVNPRGCFDPGAEHFQSHNRSELGIGANPKNVKC